MRRAAAGRALLSAIDALTLVAIAAIVAIVATPQARVRHLLGAEDEVMAALADLERREEEHRASGATDRNRDGKGEYAPLGDVLGPRRAEFERVEGTDVWKHDGYYYAVLLPDREYKPVPATSPDVVPQWAAVAELILAWPVDPGRTGMRAYCRWPGGVLLQHAIDGFPYTRDPPFPAAPLVRRDGPRARPADRYDGQDWGLPVFSPKAPPAK